MKLNWRVLLGIALLLMGVLALLQALGYFPTSGSFVAILFGVLFGLAGVAFLTVLSTGRQNWWAVIPGVVLLSLSALMLLGVLAPRVASVWGGPLFLAGISVAFWIVYALAPENWWAVIPGGVMLTLSAVALAGESGFGLEAGGLFFLGLAATFAVVALLPVNGTRMRWPWIPAGVLGVLGLIVLFSSFELMNYVWPVILIGAGVLLVVRALMRRA